MKIFIAGDHGGFTLKNEIIKELAEFNFTDLGPQELNLDDDYPDFAKILCDRLLQEPGLTGILICKSGIGMSIAANKFKGIYAALCFTPEHAKKAREHNNANVLCLDSEYGSKENHLEIVKTFLQSEFAGWETRHGRRVKKVFEIEEGQEKAIKGLSF